TFPPPLRDRGEGVGGWGADPCGEPCATVSDVTHVQIGISPFAASRDGAVRLARLAADVGLDGLTLGDGFVSTPSFPIWSGGLDCFVELGWLAALAPMASYGVDAIVLPARDP